MKRKTPDNAQILTINDSRVVVNDFRNRWPYDGYRTVEYRLFPALEESVMLPLLDEHLQRLFAGDIDAGNGDALLSLIFDPARRALTDLHRQRADHEDILRRLELRWETDREDFHRMLEEVQEENAKAEDEYASICSMIDAANGKRRRKA